MYFWFIPLIGVSLATWVEGDTNGKAAVENSQICKTTACYQVSDAFIKSMDTSVEPCVDFYHYACGGWKPEKYTKALSTEDAMTEFSGLAFNRAKEELANESPEDIPPIRMMKSIYKSCNEAKIRGLEDPELADSILRIMKGWKMIMSNYTWSNDSVTWQDVDRHYEELAGINGFFGVVTAPDPMDYAALQLKSGEEYRFRFEKKQIKTFIRKNKANISDEQLSEDLSNIEKFSKELYKESNSVENMIYTDIDSFIEWWNDNTTSIAPQAKIDWAAFFRRVLNIANLPTTNYTFIVRDANYFRNLKKLLESTDERIIDNYIHYNFLIRISPFITRYKKGYEHTYRCLNQEDPAFAHLFVKKYIGKNANIIADEMVTNMKKKFELQTRNSNWLSNKTKEVIKEKLSRMEYFIGYPKWYENETALVEYYKNVRIGESYVDSMLSWLRVTWEGGIKRWGKPLEETVWFMDATELLNVNGAYSPERNILMLPAVDFQLPITDESLPDSVRYGALGVLIGHELSHGFHAKEGLYSAYSNETLYDDEMTKIYNERVRCLKTNQTEKPTFEDEADWNGLQIAFLAYEEVKRKKYPNGESRLPGFSNFTDERMFFMSYAQRYCAKWVYASSKGHSSQEQRVHENIFNNINFAKAFNCPKNSPMNPEVKCNIWQMQV